MVTSKKKTTPKKKTTKPAKRARKEALKVEESFAATAVEAAQPSTTAKVRLWAHLSEHVLRARVGGDPVSANDGLRVYIDRDPGGILTPALLLWTGDNFKLAARFPEAIETYARIVERFADRASINGRPWAAHGLEQMALCHERLGDWPAAIAAYQRIVDGFPLGTSPAWLQYRIGRAEEEAGRNREAIAAYRNAERSALQPGLPPDEFSDLGRRAAERLERPSRGVPSVRALAASVARALHERNINALAEIASSTHFGVGVTHLDFVPFESIAEDLRRDLANSRIDVDPTALEGTSTKMTLRTDGWQGEVFKGQILFVFTGSRGGWEWMGMALTQPGTGFEPLNIPGQAARMQDDNDDDDPDPDPPIIRHPPTGGGGGGDVFWMKAPWPSGICFRAGGLNRFIASKLPFIGGFIALADTVSCCGYGPYGFYYDQGTTHRNIDKFAIDFVRYERFAPYLNRALSTHALAAHPGVVTRVVDGHSFGDMSDANRVELDWLTKAETQNFVKMGGTVQGKFRTKYLHLDRPVYVSVQMLIAQGARLGFMDHTGNSAWPHLHFSLHDRDMLFNGAPYASIPPDPLDGRPMLGKNDGDCLQSTNVAIP